MKKKRKEKELQRRSYLGIGHFVFGHHAIGVCRRCRAELVVAAAIVQLWHVHADFSQAVFVGRGVFVLPHFQQHLVTPLHHGLGNLVEWHFESHLAAVRREVDRTL